LSESLAYASERLLILGRTDIFTWLLPLPCLNEKWFKTEETKTVKRELKG
jgi:hypothetical protein